MATAKLKHHLSSAASRIAKSSVVSSTVPAVDPISRLLEEMKNSDGAIAVLKGISEDLRIFVESESQRISKRDFAELMKDLNRRIFDLVNSSEQQEKVCGIVIIDTFIDFQYEEQLSRFANYLRMVFEHPSPTFDESVVLKNASMALGHLVRVGGNVTSDFVQEEVKNALNWLEGDRSEHKRLGACLVLMQLAVEAPTIFSQFVSTFLDHIWVAIRDTKLHIRKAAVSALRACLVLISKRARRWKLTWYHKLYAEVLKGFRAGPEAVHGSLLVIEELLEHSGEFMLARFKESSDNAIQFKDNKNSSVRKEVLLLLPQLLEYCPEAFVKRYLTPTLHLFIETIASEQFKSECFSGLGKICLIAGEAVKPHLNQLIDNLEREFMKSDPYPEAFECLGMLARVGGPPLTVYFQTILDRIFEMKLSPHVVDALNNIATNVPELVPVIQEKLMTSISKILCGHSEPVDLTAPTTSAQRASVMYNINSSSPQRQSMFRQAVPRVSGDVEEDTGDEMIVLALSTLVSFNIQDENLLLFVRDVVCLYLDREGLEIRKQAVLTCADLIIPFLDSKALTVVSEQTVFDILQRLIMMVISDPSPEIRITTLNALDYRFDPYLLRDQCLHPLFTAVNDEEISVRLQAFQVLGRLSKSNPAYVLPIFRKSIVELLSTSKFSSDAKTKENSCLLLGRIIDSSPHLICPYTPSIMDSLMPLLSDPEPSVCSSAFACIGSLSAADENGLRGYVTELVPILVSSLKDRSSVTRRTVALETLGKLIQRSGWVIEPYEIEPELLPLLLDIMQHDNPWVLKEMASKLIGILGALDPCRLKQQQRRNDPIVSSALAESEDDAQVYAAVSIEALLSILKDESLSQHHSMVIEVTMYVVQGLGIASASHVSGIFICFSDALRRSDETLCPVLFLQFALLAEIVQHHLRPFASDLFQLIHVFWNTQHSSLFEAILQTVINVSKHLKEEFKVNFPDILPKLLDVLYTDRTPGRKATIQTLAALEQLGSGLEDHFDVLIPPVLELCELSEASLEVRRNALKCLGRLCRTLKADAHSSRIVIPLIRLLNSGTQINVALQGDVMELLCVLIVRLKEKFAVFVSQLTTVITKRKIQHPKYKLLIAHLMKGFTNGRVESLDTYTGRFAGLTAIQPLEKEKPIQKINFDQIALKKTWEVTQGTTKEDWEQYMRRFSIQIIRSSPSFAIRACQTIVQKHYPLARELFNVAFVSCWRELRDHLRDDLVRNLQKMFSSKSVPAEILQTFLNLVEFVERLSTPLPIQPNILGDIASECQAHAKALYYKEIEFTVSPQQTIQALISLNNQLQLSEAATGLLRFARESLGLELKESWYEKLHQWENALGAYERKQLSDPGNPDLMLGRMRCLKNLGEHKRLLNLCENIWERALEEAPLKHKVAPLAAEAAWSLEYWQKFDLFVSAIDSKTFDGSFYRSIVAVRYEKYEKARLYIDRTRKLLETDMTALLSESYERAYPLAIRLQQLTELEEIIDCQNKPLMLEMWKKRLEGVQKDVDVWHALLQVRSIVVSPHEDHATWLKYSSLCRKSGEFHLSHKVLVHLLGCNPVENGYLELPLTDPSVSYVFLKHLWATGFKEKALKGLHTLAAACDDSNPRLKSRCLLRLGLWKLSINEKDDSGQLFRQSLEYDPSCYQASHWWALVNHEKASQMTQLNSPDTAAILNHVELALRGFFHSITLGGDMILQDTLRLLNLFFTHGHHLHIAKVLESGFESIPIDTWLAVIPQIIARINDRQPQVRDLLHSLLNQVALVHPQALVYPLTVAAKSTLQSRKSAALAVLEGIKSHAPELVDQTKLVSDELIRVAILWHEQWHAGLEQASQQYFGEKDINAMLNTLNPLHLMMRKGPETLREIAFTHMYGKALEDAWKWCQQYRETLMESDLNQAWEIYCRVFQRIDKSVRNVKEIHLEYVSPLLMRARDLVLAVPGAYSGQSETIRISHFKPNLKVLDSKQRPRKFSLLASDGKEYAFLLKGHEDLRQDERVMQLFGLVNTLLASDRRTSERNLAIKRYSAIPLAPNSGILEWLGNCDTLHALIQEYRTSKQIMLQLERVLMFHQISPEKQFDQLPLLNKVDVFEETLSLTSGQDLRSMLWLKSRNSEVWLDRRTTFTKSLAVMSMVGYVLGLGDRHPSNLMLDRVTGKLIHIDFGDCFEVAMQREKFPETVPFRLTRMLTSALEVSGVEGNFRSTCVNVMGVLRDNKESVMAVLEAFVHDPLINWRLLKTENVPHEIMDSEEESVSLQSGNLSKASHRAHRHANGDESVHESGKLNEQALKVTSRVWNKLRGLDFEGEELDTPAQVQRLIEEATFQENLCLCYVGWCPFW